MAKLKCPKKLLRSLLDYIKEWLSTLLEVIVSHDQSGLYSSEILKVLEHVQNYLEPFIPLDIAESMIEDIFKDYSKGCAFKLASLRILHFPERGTVLNLGSILCLKNLIFFRNQINLEKINTFCRFHERKLS